MRTLRRASVLALAATAGATAFWMPGMLFRALTGSPVPGFLLVSFLGPLMVRGAAMRLARACARQPGAAWIAEGMLAGIWMLGPIFMLLGVAASGELSLARALQELRELYSYAPLVPLVTLIFSGSDGSLIGLLAASCVLAYTSAELRPDHEACWIFRENGGELRWMRGPSPATGRCMVCATPLERGQAVHRCPACDTAQHADCHAYLGGCARYGCRESLWAGPRACIGVI